MSRAAAWGTAVVLVHLLVNMVHGAAHRELQIGLTSAQTSFVAIVILAGPLIAAALTWTRWRRPAWILLLLTMAGSLFFGLYHHFVAAGPDHVGEQAAGAWAVTFAVTSWLLLLIEAIGVILAFYFGRRSFATPPVHN